MPKVSFILPAYKRRFLREAIASILAQTYRDFELVVVDDCSPEDLKSVVDEFHDERLSYHRNETNIGGKDLVAAWNHAMTYARAEWCVLASDDDVYLPRYLEEMMRLQTLYPHCDLFHARNADIDADGRWIAVAYPRQEIESQVEFAYARCVRRMNQRAPDFMFRHGALIAIGGFVNFPIALYSDDATWMLLAKNGCAHTRDVMFCFRESGVNLSAPHDDSVLLKNKASDMYVQWFSEFAKTLSAANDEERFMCENIERQNVANVRGLQKWTINHVRDTRLKMVALRQIGCSEREIRNCWYDRHPRIKAMRILFPYFGNR